MEKQGLKSTLYLTVMTVRHLMEIKYKGNALFISKEYAQELQIKEATFKNNTQ